MKHWPLLGGLLFSPLVFSQPELSDTDKYFPQQLSAKDLLIACSSSSLTNLGRERQKYCHGFISGVEEAVRLLGIDSKKVANYFCTPASLTSRDLAKTYLKYAARKDTVLTKPAALVVVESLASDYPCTDKK